MKVTTSITLDLEPFAEAKKRGVNLSNLFNSTLRGFLEMKKNILPNDRLHLEDELNVMKAAVIEAEKKLEAKKKKTVVIHG